MKQAFAVAIFISFVLVACQPREYSCQDPLGCLEVPPGSPIVIAALVTSTGPGASLGMDTLESIESVAAEVFDLKGHRIDVITGGTDCTPESARQAALELSRNPNLVAVIGPTCASDEPVIKPVLHDAGIIVIFPSETTPSDAAYDLFAAIEEAGIQLSDGTLLIPRTSLVTILTSP